MTRDAGRHRTSTTPAGSVDLQVRDRRAVRWGRVLRVAALSFLAASASSNSARADDPQVPVREVRKVDVGGYKLTLATQGRGGPTIVIEPGMGCPAAESDEWKAVCDEVAKTNLVCLYNRAGLGSSDPAPTKPRTSRDFARDLHTLLANAKAPGPYVLVAQSIGGMHARVFADMYPDDVAGVVLVDATHADQDAKWLAVLPAATPNEPAALKELRGFLAERQAKGAENPDGLDVVESRAQVHAAGTFREKPLAVLTHTPGLKLLPDLPDDVAKRLEDVWQELQSGSAALSTNSSYKVAEKAGHHIHEDEPKLVIDAIREVAGKVKGRPKE